MVEAVGFVVAGGQSRRMGTDKALLPWGGSSTLLDRALAALRAVCSDVRILCGPSPRYLDRGARAETDRQAAGPLAGLEAALVAAESRPALLLAVDLPWVEPALLSTLLGLLPGHDAVVPVVERPQPLCAIYAPTCLEPVRRRLAADDRKMTSFWPDVRVRPATETDLAGFALDRVFRNLNSRDDYEEARRLAAGR
ncbi:MAG TPA: molybdenum cofactor guanylyltransferase [Vicinamibacteria bacterium]